VCLSNSKQLFYNETVLMTSHYFDFDAVTAGIKDVSVSTINRLLLPNCSRFIGKSRIYCCQNLKPNLSQVPEQSEVTQSGYLVAAEHLEPDVHLRLRQPYLAIAGERSAPLRPANTYAYFLSINCIYLYYIQYRKGKYFVNKCI